MPGYAYPVEASSSEGGTIKSINYKVVNTTSPTTTFYTATSKTKVLSVLATNSKGSILPVKLYAFRDIDDSVNLLAESRILKQKYMVQELVSGDPRVDYKDNTQIDRHKTIAEFVLNQGDGLRATCPIDNVVSLTITFKEGIK